MNAFLLETSRLPMLQTFLGVVNNGHMRDIYCRAATLWRELFSRILPRCPYSFSALSDLSKPTPVFRAATNMDYPDIMTLEIQNHSLSLNFSCCSPSSCGTQVILAITHLLHSLTSRRSSA